MLLDVSLRQYGLLVDIHGCEDAGLPQRQCRHQAAHSGTDDQCPHPVLLPQSSERTGFPPRGGGRCRLNRALETSGGGAGNKARLAERRLKPNGRALPRPVRAGSP